MPTLLPTPTVTRATGYNKSQLAKFAKWLPEVKPGSQGSGNAALWPLTAAQALMIARRLWNDYGIADERLVRQLAAATAAYSLTGKGRYVVIHGLEAIAVDSVPTDQPTLLVVDLEAFRADLFICLALPHVENRFQRIKVLAEWADGHKDPSVQRAALRILEAIMNEHMPDAETARMFDVPEVVAKASRLHAVATWADDVEQRKAAEAELRQLSERERITDDSQWTSGLGEKIVEAFGVK